jgi:kinetochore protein NDC80
MAERRLSTAPFQTPMMPSGGSQRMSLAGNRQSLGPSRVRNAGNVGSAANELAGMSLNTDQPRLSMVNRNSIDPRESLNRRSSAFGKNLAGTFAGGKDPRPIREKSYQLEVIKNLINFLAKSGYPHPISQKILTAPSAKDFQNIFKFLYAQLDPGYDFGKKFEEEVPVVMKGLRYPFAGDISKSQLYAVGSMHAWPGLLSMLGWMVDLINCCDVLHAQYESGESISEMEGIQPSTEVDGGNASEKIFFDYLCKSYKLFLAGSDNFDPLISELGASFERRNEATFREVEQLRNAVTDQETEYHKLVNEESPVAKAQREHAIYTGDIEKFQKFISHLDVKRGKFDEAIRNTANEIVSSERELEEFEMTRASLQAQVDAQDICPEDIDRMNSEKDLLVKTLESLNQAREEANKVFWERELLVQKKLDAVEELVKEYNHAGEQIAVIPKEATNAKGLSLELAFNPHATRADQLVNLDVRTQIHPAFNSLREECHAIIHQAQDQLLSLQEALDKLNEACNDKLEELRNNEKRIERIIQTYLEEKESCATENKSTEEEAEQLEQTIQKLRSDTSSHSILSQQRLQRATVEYDQLVTTVAAEKERIGTDMYRLLEELINFKTHVESTLEDFETAFAREQEQC